MYYVYILKSQSHPNKHYTGITQDLEARRAKHNSGSVQSTKPYKPWQIDTYIAFTDEQKARDFEKYLKSGSGRAFAKKRL